MIDLKCQECGISISSEMDECPNCGYPVSVNKLGECQKEFMFAQNIVSKNKTAKKTSIMPYISLILGICILVFGIWVASNKPEIDTYNAKQFNVDYSAFGGDFYTEIYGAVDIIADELNAINGGIESISKSINSFTNLICSSTGMLIIAIGLSTIALSCVHIKKNG